MPKNWIDEDEKYIREQFLTQTYSDLAEHFSVSTKAMESKIRRMGLKKQEVLAEATAPPAQEPVVAHDKSLPEEPRPAPIESIHTLPRRKAIQEETKEERKARLQAGQKAAETEKARREQERTDKTTKKSVQRLQAGMKKLMRGKYSEAAEDFEAILADPPSNIGILSRATQYLRACKDHLDKKAPAPRNTEDLYLLGVMQMNAGDLPAALDSFSKASKKAPGNDRILYCQATAYAQAGEFEAALDSLRGAIKINDANRIFAKNDSDFTPLRVHKEFQQLVTADEPTDQEA
ncbi:MAG: tetratricopeptide repeat protein [Acidobacteriota bacterium]